VLNDRGAGRLPRLDRLMQLVDRRLFETKRLVLRTRLLCHNRAPLASRKSNGAAARAGTVL